MAYRFMLETPLAYASEAEIAITKAPATQIVTNRASFADGYDEPRTALTVSAPDLQVIDVLYAWYNSLDPQPSIRFVFYGGRRVELADHDAASLIAGIRRDQPWVERSIPKIGEHIPQPWVGPEASRGAAIVNAAIAGDRETFMEESVVIVEEPHVVIESVNYLAINVAELAKAESFYADLFGLAVVARTKSDDQGSYRLLSPDYDHAEALMTGEEADDSFMRNGALLIALHRVGRGARIDRVLIDRVSVRVDAESFNRLRGQVLMRNYEYLGGGDTYFSFRDPYGVPWEIAMAGALPEVIYTTLSEALADA
ncbi:MAG: VOC family protein [Thermomicrobiales bacterium]|nr:VOC family protein [Thermomicrobiales bacterium]MCO5222816.1 VOC family protein [Thermomicrobiales bacterium]